jgi:hypothetical protein
MRLSRTWAVLVGLISLAASAAEPISLSLKPITNKIADYNAVELDKLLADALKGSPTAKGASESSADVLVAPELSKTDKGKVRVLFELHLRVRPAAADFVAFEFASTRFGPMGAGQMVNGVAAKALALRDKPPPSKGGAAPSDAPVVERETFEKTADDSIPEKPEDGRFRWGLSAGVGTFLPGPLVSFGAEARAGWQFNRLLSAYLAFGGNAGVGFSGNLTGTGGSVNVGADTYYYFSAQAEAVFMDMVFVAAGPVLARGGWAFISQGVDTAGGVSQRLLAAGGDFLPAANLKVGLGIGSRNVSTGRRNQFTIALDTMFLFAPNTVTGSQSVSMNGVSQMVDVRGLAVGVAPIIVLGFDGR